MMRTAAPKRQWTIRRHTDADAQTAEGGLSPHRSNYAAVAFVDASHFTNGGIKADGHIMLMRIDAEGAGVALNDVFTNVQNVFSASAGVTVTGPVAERTQWETMINGMMALLVGLIAVAVLIALVGVANTLICR